MADEQKDQSVHDTGKETEPQIVQKEGPDVADVFEQEAVRIQESAAEIATTLKNTVQTAEEQGVDLSDEQAEMTQLQKRLELVSDQTRRQIVLRNLDESGDWFDKGDRVYTDAELESAGVDEEGFMDLVHRGLTRNPDRIFHMVSSAKILFPREELVAAFDRVIETSPHSFIAHFSDVSEYYEDKKAVLERVLSNDTGLYQAQTIFSKDEFDNIFEPEEAKRFIIQAAAKYPHTIFGTYSHTEIDTMINKGYITEEDARDLVLNTLGNPQLAGYIYVQTYADLFEGEHRETYVEAIKEAYHQEDSTLGISTLNNTKGVLDDDVRKELFLAGIEKGKKNGDIILNYPELLKEFYTEKELTDLIQDSFAKRKYDLFGYNGLPDWIAEGEYLTQEQLLEHKQILISDFPRYAFINLDYVLEAVPPEDKEKCVKDLVAKVDAAMALHNIPAWMQYVTDDLQEQKAILSDLIRNSWSYSYVNEFITPNGSDFQTDKILTRDEVKTLLYEHAAKEDENFMLLSGELRDIRIIFGSDEEFRGFVNTLVESHPNSVLNSFNTIAYLFDTDGVSNLIDRIASKSNQNAGNCIDRIKYWLPYDAPEHALAFINSQKEINAASLISKVGEYKTIIPENQQEDFLHDIIKADPPMAMTSMDSLTPHLADLTIDEIAQIALADQERMAYAPGTFSEFYKRVLGSSDITDKKALLMEMHDLYGFIASARVNGLQDAHRHIIEGKGLSPKQEQLLLANIACAAYVKEKNPADFEQMGSLGETPEELAGVVLQELGRRVGITTELTPEQRTRFLDTMDTPAPFLIYVLQYEDSPQHKTVLDGIAQGILNGNYKEWKYGESTQRSIEELHDKKLLPSLTTEQYNKWQENDKTTLQETLAADADTVVRAVRRLIYENGNHFSETLFKTPDADFSKILRDAQDELTEVGQEYGQVARELNQYKTDQEKASTEALALQERRAELADVRDELNMTKNLLRIMLLQPMEVSSGYILEGTKKTTKITKVLDDLTKLLNDQEAKAVIENMRQLIVDFHEQTSDKQNLVAEDTDDPKVLLELGAKPVGSCQHYAHGEYNECLLGYSDANTKVVTLKNERGNLVARAVLRLLPTQNGEAALHLEKIYSASASQGVTRTIYAHVEAKAQALGMKAYLSKQAQDEHGNLIEAETIPGFQLVDTDATMQSEASRAPKSYVDSAKGAVQNGKFELNNLQILKAA